MLHLRSISASIAVLSVFGFLTVANANIEEANDLKGASEICATLLGDEWAANPLFVNHKARALSEHYGFIEFFKKGGVAYQRPIIAMEAAQRLKAVILSQGTTEVADPMAESGKRTLYHIFSSGGPLAGNMRIVGHLGAIERIVQQIDAQAEGAEVGKYPVLIQGVPGTGKSHIIKILNRSVQTLTLIDPKYFDYTFEFVGLEVIPQLKAFASPNGQARRSAMNEIPAALLPPSLQAAYLKAMEKAVRELNGYAPRPKLDLQPADDFIRSELIKYYTEKKGSDLTLAEELDVLNRHVRIVRRVVDSRSFPIIAAQNKDVDISSLFFQANPSVRFDYGPSHPLAVHYNGLLPSANGWGVLMDEATTYPKPFRDKLLNTIEDRTLSEGGVPPVPYGAYFLFAGNRSGVEKIKEEDPKSPFLDRTVPVFMDYPINPYEVGSVFAYVTPNLWMTPLTGAAEQRVPALVTDNNAKFLFPYSRPGEPLKGPDGRFNIYLGDPAAGTQVHMAPQSLMFLSEVTALTRMNFDPEAAKKLARFPVIGSPLFRDEATRLMAYMGQIQGITGAQKSELLKLSELLKEGSFGLTPRQSSIILRQAYTEARKGGNCITPTLILEVMESQYRKGAFGSTPEEGLRWLTYGKLVLQKFTIEGYQQSISSALLGAQNGGVLAKHYDEIVQEIVALHQDSTAESYDDIDTGETKTIRKPRLAQVTQIYQEKYGKPLTFDEIALFEIAARRGRRAQAPGTGNAQEKQDRDMSLLQAIAAWQGRNLTLAADASMGRILEIGSGHGVGNEEERGLSSGLVSELMRSHGFCPHCVKHALQLVDDQVYREQQKKAKPQQ